MLFQTRHAKASKAVTANALNRATFEFLERREMLAAHIVGSAALYTTIQAAVDAASPGATVTVDPGQYNEMVWIGKQLTVRGAAAGIDARSNGRATAQESVLNGVLNPVDNTRGASFYIAADDVTIDGFTVQNETSQSVISGAGIVIAPKVSGTHLFNNIVQQNVAGVFLSNYDDAKPAVIYHNLFRDNNNPGLNGGRGIFTDGGISGGKLSNVIIDSNAFIRNFGSTGTTTVEAAVAFEAIATPQSNIRITNNIFDTNGKAMLFFTSDHITVQNNTITYSKDQWSAALRFEGNTQTAVIQGNTFAKNTGPAIRIDNKGVPGDNTNFTITQNNFYEDGLFTVTAEAIEMQPLQYVGILNATNNYYGSASGPGGAGPGSGELIIANGINVNFTPWSTTRFPVAVSAYQGVPWSIDHTIQVEDFDQGSEAFGYHDSEYTNYGNATSYRYPAGVDLENTTDASGGYNIGYVKSGEWLNYTVNVAQAGIYNLAVRVASYTAGGNFHFELDGVNVTGALAVPNTTAWQNYTTLTKTGVILPAGVHTLRLVMDTQGASTGATGNFNWFKFSYAGAVPTAPSGLVASITTGNRILLNWTDQSNDETNFIIERQTGLGAAWQIIQTLDPNITSYIDTSAVAGNLYTYRIHAISAAGNSIDSNEASVVIPTVPPLVYLSTLPFAASTNGWGPVERDQSVGGSGTGDGNPITLNGVVYPKGLGVHAVSDITYNLNGAFNSFISDIGLDDETGFGSVVFQVFADNVKIFDSGVMFQDSLTQTIKLNIAGVLQLRLHVGDGNGSTSFDHADWAGARVLLESLAPATPTGVVASATMSSQISLTWSDVAGETGYRIERSLDGTTGWTQIGNTLADTTLYNDTTVSGSSLFYYRVTATSPTGDSAPSTVASSTPLLPPAAPLNAVATAFSPTQINLSWTPVSNAAGYKIERSPDGATSWTPIGTTLALAFYTDTTVSGSSLFYYRIIATNAAGDSLPSLITSSTPLLPPAIPTNLIATPVSSTRINLTWTDGASETGSTIERSLDGLTGWTPLITTPANATTYSDSTGLAASTPYYYRVRAANTAGNSDYSTIASATTLSQPAPAAPSNLLAVASSGTQINLTWSDNSLDETNFILERSANGVDGWTTLATPVANTTAYSDTLLTNGATWFYRIRATNLGGDSQNSNNTSATTLTPPAAPIGAVASATTSSQISLIWSDVTGETSYKIERSLDGATAWTQIAALSANATSYANSTGLSASTKYYYRIRATNAVGDSAYSTVVSATTLTSNGLPAGWSDGDVGAVNSTGKTTFASGIFTLITGGSDIWNAADTEHFTYQSLTGDGTLIARVSSMQNTNVWANAGIQMRDSLAANSRQVSAVVTPANGVVMTFRTTTAGATDGIFKSGGAPEWFKLNRAGNTFTSFQSNDGIAWTQIGSTTLTMASTIYAGLVGTSKNTTTTNTQLFDNVSLTPAIPAIPVVPAAPTGLAASAASSSQINLTWSDNSNNETNFILERSQDGLTAWTQIAAPAAGATSFSNTALTASTAYYYRLRATNAVGDSANTPVATATTPAAPVVPAAPGGAVASATTSSQINLTWTDVTTETSYKIERSLDGATNWTQIATPSANSTSYSDSTGLSPSTKYFYRIRAANAAGDSNYSTVVNATTQPAPVIGLPAGWTTNDIGPVAAKGSTNYANGTFTVVSGGSDIWNNSDTFHFAYTTLTGDGTIIARVASMQNTNAWANAGIQIRDSLAANSKEASLVVTPNNGVVMTSRSATGGATNGIFTTGGTPEWLKLVRQGSTITSYKSVNGTTWTLVGSVSISMGSTVYLGLAVTAKNPTTTNTAKFDNVSVTNSII